MPSQVVALDHKKEEMRNLIIILALILLPGCKLWEWGEIYKYEIPKGKHSDMSTPMLIEGTEVWGGEMVLYYDPEQMVDEEYNFGYWNKLGGMMPDIIDNVIEGKHQSARAAWRIDPPVLDSVYLGYIVYIYGLETPERGYLLTDKGERIAVPMGRPFTVFVSKKQEWWSVSARYGGKEAYKRVDDPLLKREKFLVVMDPYYGGHPPAPTNITITLKIKDTTWLY